LNNDENIFTKCSDFDTSFDVLYFPHVSIGWDRNPRHPSGIRNTVIDSTPRRFRLSLEKAKEYADKHPEQPRLITINAWNEWCEGSYLEPDKKWKFGYLDAVNKVFGGK